jgi:hypothetical protein
VLLLDFEACDYLNAGRMAGQSNSKNETEFGSVVVKLPQWPSLRAELEQMGEAHGAKFTDADMTQMKHWGRNQTDFRQYVWNAIVVSLTTARALNASIVEPLLALFPDAHISNYAHKYVTSRDPLPFKLQLWLSRHYIFLMFTAVVLDSYHVAGPGLRTERCWMLQLGPQLQRRTSLSGLRWQPCRYTR